MMFLGSIHEVRNVNNLSFVKLSLYSMLQRTAQSETCDDHCNIAVTLGWHLRISSINFPLMTNLVVVAINFLLKIATWC